MNAAPKQLASLLEGMVGPGNCADIRVHGLTLDSRHVQHGDAFIALKGGSTHGIMFAPAALARGASVIIAEAPAPVVLELEFGNRDSGIDTAEPANLDAGAVIETFFPPLAGTVLDCLPPQAGEGARRAKGGSTE